MHRLARKPQSSQAQAYTVSLSISRARPKLIPSVKALYSYTAADTDEVSIHQGETYELTALGTDYAEGWYQVVVDGRTGVVPSTYVEVCQ